MKGKSRKLDRWASVSALASSALAASSGPAAAAIIFHPTPGLTIPASGSHILLPLPGGNRILLTFGTKFTSHRYTNFYRIFISGTDPEVPRVRGTRRRYSETFTVHLGAKGVPFRTDGGLIATAKKGQTFNLIGHGSGAALIGTVQFKRLFGRSAVGYRGYPRDEFFSRTRYSKNSYIARPGYRRFRFGSIHSYFRFSSTGFIRGTRYSRNTAYSPASYSNQFALFRFDVGSQTDYGWLELSLRNGFDTGPIVDVIGYAYDTSGKPIPAGAVPEPKELPLALAALALGAMGVRELRGKRKAAT